MFFQFRWSKISISQFDQNWEIFISNILKIVKFCKSILSFSLSPYIYIKTFFSLKSRPISTQLNISKKRLALHISIKNNGKIAVYNSETFPCGLHLLRKKTKTNLKYKQTQNSRSRILQFSQNNNRKNIVKLEKLIKLWK